MSITIASNEIGTNPSPFTKGTIGEYITWNIEIHNTGSWYGKTVYFNLSQFISTTLPQQPTNILPELGFSVTLPGAAPATGQFGWMTANNDTERNYRVQYNLVDANTLRINTAFLLTADTDNFVIGQTVPSVWRMSKSIITNPAIYDNTPPSVYNDTKLLRGHVVIGDPSTGIVEDQVFADMELQARFYEEGGEFTDWSFTLERNGETVTNLSAYNDTTLIVQVDANTATIDPGLQIFVFRENGAVNTTDFITDLKAGIHINSTLIQGIDYIVSVVPPALVSGTVYEIEIVIDSDSIENGSTYRIIPIVFDTVSGVANSATTAALLADALPDPVAGTITGNISDYNDIFTGDCLQAATVERLKACASIDKASYNSDLALQNLPGDFDSNFFSYQVQVVTTFGGETVVIDLNDKQEVPELEIVDAFDAYTSCLTFRVRPEWAGLLLQINHIFTFNVPLPGAAYTDVITYRQVVNANDLEEEQSTPFIVSMELFDNNNDPVTEICEDFAGPLRVEVTKTTTVEDYNLIAYIAKGAGQGLIELQEQEDYTNNILPQLDSQIIDTVDVQFVSDVASFTIEQELLEVGQDYRVYATAKKVNLTPPVSCPVIDIFTRTEVGSILPSGGDLILTMNNDFVISNFAPDTVTNVDVWTKTQNPKSAGINQYNNFLTDTGAYNYLITFAGGFTGDPILCQMDIEVTLSSGCTYTYTVRHEIIPQLNRITTKTESVNAN